MNHWRKCHITSLWRARSISEQHEHRIQGHLGQCMWNPYSTPLHHRVSPSVTPPNLKDASLPAHSREKTYEEPSHFKTLGQLVYSKHKATLSFSGLRSFIVTVWPRHRCIVCFLYVGTHLYKNILTFIPVVTNFYFFFKSWKFSHLFISHGGKNA